MGGGAGWSTHARHGYPHLVFNKCCFAINHFFRFTIPIQKIFRFRAAVFLSGSTTDTSWILLPSSPSPGARRVPARTAGPPPSWRFRRRFAPSVTWTSSPRPTDRRDIRDNTSLSPIAPGSLYLKVLLLAQPSINGVSKKRCYGNYSLRRKLG